jgi:hypothetical protein
MSDWLHSLPVLWMAILVFGFTYLITAGIYAVITVLAASILLILAHDRPFTGEIAIKPDPLLQVMPEIASSR